MHGRQKKERTAEEEDAKKKEQAKKVAAYRHAMGLIFAKREKNELDEELLKITGQVLAANPDIGTLWNIRKETLLQLKQADSTNFADVIVPKELDFSEFCLKSNPKSYGAWHHRYWLMVETNFSRVSSELKLLAKYLEFDDRNFHAWDYRRFLLDNCPEVTVEQELEFTTEKISSNFSNFSSWHLRSKLLPKLQRNYLEEELELIRNAVFTDPKDQSAWFYHRWLLKSQLPPGSPSIVGAQYCGSQISLIFSSVVPSPSQIGIQIDVAGNWHNPWNNTCSKLWQYSLQTTNDSSISIQTNNNSSLLEQIGFDILTLKPGDVKKSFPGYFDPETETKTPEFLNLLKEEMSWVQELHELEHDIKWPIVTLIMLKRMVDFVGYKNDILKHLEGLIKLDSKRMNYYLDLRSKYLIEWNLAKICKPSTGLEDNSLDLSGLNLTAFYYPERFCFHTEINLCNNSLKNHEPFRALLNCKSLQISGNKLSELQLRNSMPLLENLKL